MDKTQPKASYLCEGVEKQDKLEFIKFTILLGVAKSKAAFMLISDQDK